MSFLNQAIRDIALALGYRRVGLWIEEILGNDLQTAVRYNGESWDSRGHFFAAAAEAMRRILVEIARRKTQARRVGHMKRIERSEADPVITPPHDQLLLLDEALTALANLRPQAAQIVQLRFFAERTIDEAAGWQVSAAAR